MSQIDTLVQSLPKAELHLHIEGTLEPELAIKFARRNGIPLNVGPEELRRAYDFKNLQDFLNVYYRATDTLRTRDDFYELTMHYFRRARENNIVHAEIFYDPQAHMRRGVRFEVFTEALLEAMRDARGEYGISSNLILSFLRDLPEEDALKVLDEATAFLNDIVGVGLDSAEVGNPPSKFSRAFSMAKDLGLMRVAHAGEEGPPEYVWEAIEVLDVHRIDHGVRSVEDDSLMHFLADRRIPLTMCPLSNLKLKVVNDLRDYPLREFLDRGIIATVNSDDPAYFGGYLNENFLAVQRALNLGPEDICTLASNSILASFIPGDRKRELLGKIDEICGSAPDS